MADTEVKETETTTETEEKETEDTETINEAEIEKQALTEKLSDLKKELAEMKKQLVEVKKLNYKLLQEQNVESEIDFSQFSTR